MKKVKISWGCEVLSASRPDGYCGALATVAYPSADGNYMALCPLHAEPHAAYVLPIGAIERGERHPMWKVTADAL